ncbi:MAG: PAS domain S-box protein [Microcoleus sp. SIO2G3]|nr:PAS domain S-box protein [Microcoleus sp. SIO2G3]
MKIGTHGEAFIIERSGMLVASSTSELPFVSSADGKEQKRIRATETTNPLMRTTAKHLVSHFGNFTNINALKQLEFEIEGRRQFTQVTPFKDQFGLDWLIVVVVPEADFMEQINANTYTTILLCIAAFLVATGIGIITARWITKPILRLNTAVKDIAKGEWNKIVEIKRSDEVGQLAESFRQMAAQLQDSFAELTALNEALHTSDRKFRAIFNQTFQFTGMLSLDGILVEVNQTALDFGGLQPDDVIGKLFWDCYWWTICPETQTQLQEAINRAVNGEFIRYEVDVLGAKNHVITVDFSLKPIFDENGNVEFLISEGRDITERKQAQNILNDYNRTLEAQVAERTAQLIQTNEQLKHEIAERKVTELALKQQKEILQTIFDNIPGMLCFYSADAEVQFINKAFENTLGWSLEELRAIDMMAQCYPDPEYRAEVLEFMMRADGTWQDVQLRTRTGHILFTSWANVRLPDGSTVGIGKDITERKQAELALQEREYRLRTLGDNLPNGMIYQLVHEPNGNVYFSYVSAGIERLVGVKPEAIMQDSSILHELIVEEDRLLNEQLTEESRRNLSIFEMQMRKQTPTGDIQWSYLRSAPRRLDDGRTVWDGIEMDITALKQIEEALRQSEERWQLVLKSINAGIWDINFKTGEVFHSQRWKELLGYQDHEIENNNEEWFNRIHPDDFDRVMANRQAYLDQEIPSYSAEYRLRCKDDSYKWLLSRGLALWDEQGNLVRFIGSYEDITDRKRAEEALRESASRERAIATVLQKMRQTLDINTIFSATTEELRGVVNCDRVAIYRFNPDWSGEFVAESVADGWVPLMAQQNNEPDLKEDAVEDSNCTIKTLNVNNDYLVQDTYLQDTRGGAYTKGINYRVTQDIYNAGFSRCYLNLLERFQVRAYIIVPIFCGSKLWGLLAIYQNSAPRCWSESQISALVQIGVQLGVALQQVQLLQHTQQQAVALKLALDELKRTQAQLIQTEKMSSLGRMVAGIAHEINNPVSFIYGNLTPARHYFQDLLNLVELYQQTYPQPTPEIQQLASDIDVDFLMEDWQKLIDSMQVGTERIREIVLSLRNFSRLDEKELKAVDIHQGINNTLLILQHRLKAAGSRPETEVIKNYGQLPLVTCYASQLNQVFMNLLANAIDALETQPSPRKISISTSVDSGNDQQTTNCVVIRIADNGSGMSEAVKEKIFDPFFTTKPVGSGTGLGLSISYQIIVEKHKGKISCVSTPGEGTEFIVEIPLNLPA